MAKRDKYEDVDKQISKEIMEPLKGKIIEHKCQDCSGRGYFNMHMGPMVLPPIICENCQGTGKYEVEY